MKWLIIVAGVACNASASVLVKLAMVRAQQLGGWGWTALYLNLPLGLGVGLYGLAFALYAAALARLPLNVAHPILTAGSIATVAALSVALFHEPMPWTTQLGIALVAAGVMLIASRAA